MFAKPEAVDDEEGTMSPTEELSPQSHDAVRTIKNGDLSLMTYAHGSTGLQSHAGSEAIEAEMLTRSNWQDQEHPHLRRVSTASTQRPSRQRRSSYRSVREDLDTPQSFTVSTYTVQTEDATHEERAAEAYGPSCDGADRIVRRWKSSKLRGRLQSSSLSDLKRWFGAEQSWALNASGRKTDSTISNVDSPVERRGLEAMPPEIMDNILSFVGPDGTTDSLDSRSRDLMSCMLVSRPMYALSIDSLYTRVSVPHPMMFAKFMSRLRQDPSVGSLVKRLDFSRYSNIGFGRTPQASSEATNLNSAILLQCLDVMPKLQEFLVHEHLDDEISEEILTKLVSMPTMRALDFCACGSKGFVDSFTAISEASFTRPLDRPDWLSQIERLSLHECATLQSPVFAALLPQLPRLTHLDVAHTLITDEALLAIPTTARLTHLNLSRCTRLTGEGVVGFLTQHPAAKDSLICLSLMADSRRHRLLSDLDCTALIPNLPHTLRSLNLGGAQLNDTHLPALMPLTRVLEELSVKDAHLSASGLESIFAAPDTLSANASEWLGSSLRYIDVSGVPELNHRSVHYSLAFLTSEESLPLEVIELSEHVVQQLQKLRRPPGEGDWIVKTFGRRGWYVRQAAAGARADSGARSWKMGARWWGMRKMPVSDMEVGGMYGYYMFKN